MERPTLNDEIVTRPAEHEIFLSFNDDQDAERFAEWWESVGFEAFQAWERTYDGNEAG